MASETSTFAEFKVQEGFGPFDEGLKECWCVKSTKKTFADEESAQEFAERRYEERVARLIKSQPDCWKSYWVRVVQA